MSAFDDLLIDIQRTMKFYVHHLANPALVYKLAHNLEDFSWRDQLVSGTYQQTPIEFHFNTPFSNQSGDGYHLLDLSGCLSEGKLASGKPWIAPVVNQLVSFFQRCVTVAEQLPVQWIFVALQGEKLLCQNESIECGGLEEVELLLRELREHVVVTDNHFLTPGAAADYPQLHYALTTSLFQWNADWGVRWCEDVGKLYNRLSFDADLIYSVRNHKEDRVERLLELHRLQLPRVRVQHSDALPNARYEQAKERLAGVPLNSIRSGEFWDHLDWPPNHRGYLDAYFHVMLQARMLLLDESWGGGGVFYVSQYLSEKTWSAVLSGIPFLPTHIYPVELLSLILDLPTYPALTLVRSGMRDLGAWSKMIQAFMEHFESHYTEIRAWTLEAQRVTQQRVRTENSLLELALGGFQGPCLRRSLL